VRKTKVENIAISTVPSTVYVDLA